MLGPGVKQRRSPICAGLSFPNDTRAACQRQHSHALPPPHSCSQGLEHQPLLFLLLALPLARLCLALAPEPPGNQQGGGWGRGSWWGLPQRLPVNLPSQHPTFLESPRLPMQTGFPSSLACRLEPNFSATGSREKDEEGGLQGSGLSMLLAASRPEPGPAGSTPPHTHSRLTLALRHHTTFTAGKSLAHLTQIPQAVEQALAFPYLPGCRLA